MTSMLRGRTVSSTAETYHAPESQWAPSSSSSAGTGKGVVIDAAARAEQMTGHRTFGIAVSGSTAQRLGQDSPALAGQTLTLDALVARVQRGLLSVDDHTTVYFDEAGMADTDRLDRLTELIADTGGKLVAIGDAAQLPSIGAGGMLDRLAESAPSARLSNVRRTLNPGRTAGMGGPARRQIRPGDGALPLQGSPAHGRHPRRGRRARRPELGEAHRDAPDRAGRADLRRLEQGNPPAERPRTAPPQRSVANSASSKSRCPASTTASAPATASR